jgi:hypothetical protein
MVVAALRVNRSRALGLLLLAFPLTKVGYKGCNQTYGLDAVDCERSQYATAYISTPRRSREQPLRVKTSCWRSMQPFPPDRTIQEHGGVCGG